MATNPCCGVETCDDPSYCCDEPQAYVKEAGCVIQPVADCIDVDTILADENVEQTQVEALLMDEGCEYLIVSEDCKPIFGGFPIEE